MLLGWLNRLWMVGLGQFCRLRGRLRMSRLGSVCRCQTPLAVGGTLSARYSVGQSLVQPMEVGGAYAGASGVMSATTSASYATEVGGEGIAAIPTVRAPSEPKQQVGERANAVTASGSRPRVGAEVVSGEGELLSR